MRDRRDTIDLQWGRFAGRMAVGFAWLVSSAISFQGMIAAERPAAFRLAMAAIFLTPVLTWLLLVGRSMKHGDELDQVLETRALAAGCIHIVAYSAIVLVLATIAELLGLLPNGAGRNQAAVIAALPPLAMIMGQVIAQFTRARMAKEEV